MSKSRYGALGSVLKERRGGKAQVEPAKRLAKSKDKENYVQTTAYIAKPIHREVQVALAEEGKEFSQLVEDLLAGWTRTRKRSYV